MPLFSRHRGLKPPSLSREDCGNALFAYPALLGGRVYIPGELDQSVRIQDRTIANAPFIERVQRLISSMLCRAWGIPEGYRTLAECDIEDFCFLLNRARFDALAQGWVPRNWAQQDWPEFDAEHGRQLLALLPLPGDSVEQRECKSTQLRNSVRQGSYLQVLRAFAELWTTRDLNESHFLSTANHAVFLRAVLERREESRTGVDVEFLLDRVGKIRDGNGVSAALEDLHGWVLAFGDAAGASR